MIHGTIAKPTNVNSVPSRWLLSRLLTCQTNKHEVSCNMRITDPLHSCHGMMGLNTHVCEGGTEFCRAGANVAMHACSIPTATFKAGST